jgi:hypothetical protein
MRAGSASYCCGRYLRHWTCLRFHLQWRTGICILGYISGRIFYKFYVSVYFRLPDICNVGSQAVSASVCFGGFIRLLRLDFSLVNWQIITVTFGRLLQFLLKFEIVSKTF